MTRPEQAVILCGGLGTRLRPLTDTMPKPMAPVNGRPFLAYLIEQLREQGIRRVVLLTGYRGEMIRDYFAEGVEAGVEVSYSHGPVEWETGRRIWEARAQLDPRFLLLYSDNFAPFDLDRLQAFHEARGVAVTLVVQKKAKANIRLSDDGMVELYDSTRSAAGLQFVEIGYMLVERDRLLPSIDDPDASFSRTIGRLAQERQLAGLVSGDPYHSISDPERLALTERYLASKRILLIDRDGTINERAPRGEYVMGWEQFRWIDSTVEAMRKLAGKGFRFIVLSNQAGIGRGVLEAGAVDAMNARMCEELRGQGIDVLRVYLCPHHWEDRCECRKPEPGMFFRASVDHQLRLDRTIYVGDDPRDSHSAYNAHCVSALIGPERFEANGHPWEPARVAETLVELEPWIASRFEEWERVP